MALCPPFAHIGPEDTLVGPLCTKIDVITAVSFGWSIIHLNNIIAFLSTGTVHCYQVMWS